MYGSSITVETIDLAICVNEFYFTNFKMITSSSVKVVDDKIFKEILIKKAISYGATQTDVIAITRMAKSQASKLWHKYLNEIEMKLKTEN